MNGQILAGRYLVGEILGSGGMGAVYRGVDLRTGGPVAIKIPHPWLTVDTDFITRLHREAQIAAALVSPRIVKVIDFDWHKGRPFLVMEYVPGKTLAEVLSERGALTWQEATRIALEVARALDVAHRNGIVHRDLKPQNIKILDDGDVKVLDFGIARAESLPSVTAASVVVGTPQYMAPERLGGPTDDPADATVSRGDVRSDIYALGVILHEMLTGRPPFQAGSHWAVIRAHLSDPPPPLPDTVPAAVQEVVRRCLAKRPRDRFQTPAELVAALRALTVTAPIEATPVASALAATDERLVDTGAPTLPAATLPQATTVVRPDGDQSDVTPTVVNGAGVAILSSPPDVSASAAPFQGRRWLPWLAAGAVVLALAAGSGIAVVVRRGEDTERTRLIPTPTIALSQSSGTPTPAPTAAPVLVDDVRIYRSGADFLAGQPPVQELTIGDEVTVCFAYHGAGAGTSITLSLTGADGSPAPVPRPAPLMPTVSDDVRCESFPEAAALAPGRYAVLVQDRGEIRARQEFTLVEPPPPPPPPSPSPQPTAGPRSVATPTGVPTAVTRPPAPLSPPPPPPPPPSPTRTPLPAPSGTLEPGR